MMLLFYFLFINAHVSGSSVDRHPLPTRVEESIFYAPYNGGDKKHDLNIV